MPLDRNAITPLSRYVALEVAIPGQHVCEFVNRLHSVAGSWPGRAEVPDRYYSIPDGRLTVRFLVPEDMEKAFWELLRSFAQEKGLAFDPSGAVASARLAA